MITSDSDLQGAAEDDPLYCGELVGNCPWHIIERPLSAFVNTVEQLRPQGTSPWSIEPPPEGDLQALLGGSQEGRLIHKREFGMFSQLLRKADDAGLWDVVLSHPSSGCVVKRLKGETDNGPLSILLQIKMKGIPIEEAARVLNNFSERSQWDKQSVRFHCHDDWGAPVEFNGLFYFALHAPPLTDRDFLNYFAAAKADDGNAYMTIARAARHPSYSPRKGNVRAHMHGNVALINRDSDPGSTIFTVVTKQDIFLPIVPHWLINKLLPGQFSAWNDKMQRACRDHLQLATELGHFALEKFFTPRPGYVANAVSVPDQADEELQAKDLHKSNDKDLVQLPICKEQTLVSSGGTQTAQSLTSKASDPSTSDILEKDIVKNQQEDEIFEENDGDLKEYDNPTALCCKTWLFGACKTRQ